MKTNNQAFLGEITDLLLDAICVVNRQGRFVSIKGACQHIFGYLPEEMIGKPMIDFVFHEDRERTLRAVDRIMSGYQQRYFENRYVRKDGQIVHIMWSARWSPDDQVRVAVARDITNRECAYLEEILPTTRCWRLSEKPPQLIPPNCAPIPLSGQDYKVLLALATGGECVSRETIVLALGQDFMQYDQRRLDTQMRRLRRKVEQASGRKLPVTTLRGIGYRFYEMIEVCR